jgi:hypothetical protein
MEIPSVAILAQAFVLAQAVKMASDDETMSFPAPAVPGVGGDDSSDECLSFPVPQVARGSSGLGVVASRLANRRGTFGALLLSIVPPGPVPAVADSVVEGTPTQLCCIGLCVCDWSFKEPSAALAATHSGLSSTRVPPPSHTSWGYVHYEVTESWKLSRSVPVPEGLSLNTVSAAVAIRRLLADSALEGATTVGAVVASALVRFDCAIVLPLLTALQVFASPDLPLLIRSVRLEARVLWDRLVQANPKKKHRARMARAVATR